ncbi:hypothetical protein RQP46_001054 [Phenoliferia psychrophenolica]
MNGRLSTVAPLSPPLSSAFKIELNAREEQRKSMSSETSGLGTFATPRSSVYGSKAGSVAADDIAVAPRPRTSVVPTDIYIQQRTYANPEDEVTHLPDIQPGSNSKTALENWDVEHELEYTVGKIMGEKVFESMMMDKDAKRRFREFLETSANANPLILDLYNDMVTFSSLTAKLRAATQAIEDVYLLKDSPNRLQLPISVRGPLIESLHRARVVGIAMHEPQKEILGSLFNTEFQAFMQKKLVDSALARLGTWSVAAGTGDGLADSFCLTNPRLRDHPIVLASEGFSTLTQYPLTAIVGRNCRFLQGPGTSPDSVLRLRNALNAGENITSLLLNYRKDGTPFFNLLCMLPLKDPSGNVKYYLGGQIDVTKDMPSILGSQDGSSTPKASKSKHRFSPAVQTRSDSILVDPNAPMGVDLSLSRTDSRSTIGTTRSGVRASVSGGIGSGAFGNSASINGLGSRTIPKKASKGTDLGLTREEHAAGMQSVGKSSLTGKLSDFEETYSRVILIRKEGGTVLFGTPGLATFCGVSKGAVDDLVGTEFCKLIAGPTKDVSHRLRGNIRTALHAGHSYSLAVGLQLKAPAAKDRILRRKDRSEIRKCFLHLTPIADAGGNVEAFVAVFGALQ